MRSVPTLRVLSALLAAMLLLGPAAVRAQSGAKPAPAPASAPAEMQSSDRPWAKGVSEDDQRRALELFGKGNGLLKDSLFVQAAAQYRDALKSWDHPAIHYNLVLALLNLDQPVEVLQHLEAAMRYGAAPLDADKFNQARAYKKLVEGQLSRVDIRCEIPGARVVMDGRELFIAPGRHEAWVRAGPHTIVASADGYLTRELSQSLPPGETTVMNVELFKQEELTVMQRRFPVWLPWTTLAAGLAVSAGGVALHQSARGDFALYDQSIVDCGGCVPGSELTATLQRGEGRQQLAWGSYGLGGAALATGAVLLYFNKPEAVQLTQEELDKRRRVSVVPHAGPGSAGLLATGRF